ncbi:hypothetical protein QBC42DRAFT_284822 [Cladorrhinum samala]|uniref:Uncharacterized protein n=1 Tax=Cladorrhinum samala TaxID=585594 RepID=A0AAV9HTQ9_9PEZI|nr:hypothetical protein QBC42DRAFT_284822 [Cladorrhinum samala]
MTANHNSTYLQIPSANRFRSHTGPPVFAAPKPALSYIPSRRISVDDLNELLIDLFPGGEYNVDLNQNTYKIQAPRQIGDHDLVRCGK